MQPPPVGHPPVKGGSEPEPGRKWVSRGLSWEWIPGRGDDDKKQKTPSLQPTHPGRLPFSPSDPEGDLMAHQEDSDAGLPPGGSMGSRHLTLQLHSPQPLSGKHGC